MGHVPLIDMKHISKVKWYLTQGTASHIPYPTERVPLCSLELTTCRSIGTQTVHITLSSAIDTQSPVTPNITPSVVIHNDPHDIPLDTIISDIISHEWGDAVTEYRAAISRVQLPHSLTWVPDGDRRITTHYFLYNGKCIDRLSISIEPTQAYAFIVLDKKSRERCYIGPIRLPPGIISEAVLNEAIRGCLEANSFLRGQPKYLSACLNLIDREIPALTYNPTLGDMRHSLDAVCDMRQHSLEHCDTGNMSPYIDLPHATIARVWGRLAYTYSVDYRESISHSQHYGESRMTVMVVPNNQDSYSLLIELRILDPHHYRNYSYIPIGPIVLPLPISERVLYEIVRDTIPYARHQLYREGARGCHPDYFIPVYYNRLLVRQIISDLLGEWRHIKQVLDI